MELYLQFGYGMKSLTLNLSKLWNGVTTILSPRDMTYNQLKLWCRPPQPTPLHTGRTSAGGSPEGYG